MSNLADVNLDEPVLTARALLADRWKRSGAPRVAAPAATLISYQREPLAHLLKRYRATRIDGFFGELHVIQIGQSRIGVMRPAGPSAPIVAALMEELIAFGVKRFISIGVAGGLQSDLQSGDVVVCDRAVRDEGTSDHYLPPAPSVEAEPELTHRLSAALSARGLGHHLGASWTTDAPYRELRRDVRTHRDAGVQTVEMEAAALFAVARRLNVQAAAVFVIGDSLADLTWRPVSQPGSLHHSLKIVAESVIEVLSADSMSSG